MKDGQENSQGLKSSLCSFHTIATFIVTKSVLNEVKALSSKQGGGKQVANE